MWGWRWGWGGWTVVFWCWRSRDGVKQHQPPVINVQLQAHKASPPFKGLNLAKATDAKEEEERSTSCQKYRLCGPFSFPALHWKNYFLSHYLQPAINHWSLRGDHQTRSCSMPAQEPRECVLSLLRWHHLWCVPLPHLPNQPLLPLVFIPLTLSLPPAGMTHFMLAHKHTRQPPLNPRGRLLAFSSDGSFFLQTMLFVALLSLTALRKKKKKSHVNTEGDWLFRPCHVQASQWYNSREPQPLITEQTGVSVSQRAPMKPSLPKYYLPTHVAKPGRLLRAERAQPQVTLA